MLLIIFLIQEGKGVNFLILNYQSTKLSVWIQEAGTFSKFENHNHFII